MKLKQDYYLRISDKATNEILFRKKFETIFISEAIYQAEKYLINDTGLTRNRYPNIEFCLTTIRSRKIIKNIMNWEYNSWDNFLNGKENKVNKSFTLKTARFANKSFIGFFCLSLLFLLSALLFPHKFELENLNSVKVGIGFLNFLLGLVYTSIVSTLRDEFNYSAKAKRESVWHKEIILHNLKLELPIFIAAMSTIISFYTEEIKGVPIYVVLILAIIMIGFKIIFDIFSDIDKLYYNKSKHLYMKAVE